MMQQQAGLLVRTCAAQARAVGVVGVVKRTRIRFLVWCCDCQLDCIHLLTCSISTVSSRIVRQQYCCSSTGVIDLFLTQKQLARELNLMW
jgi:hypothetical protein